MRPRKVRTAGTTEARNCRPYKGDAKEVRARPKAVFG